jgi:diguanylate cyclase (GGDEF)-like protein
MNIELSPILSEQGLLIDTAALAAVATVGYLFGRRPRRPPPAVDGKLQAELTRAHRVADQLEQLAARIQDDAATHRASVSRFLKQVTRMQNGEAEAAWRSISQQADCLVAPTTRLSANLTSASDELRRHESELLTFAASRIDATTGLQNRRSMEEQLEAQLSLHNEGGRRFSLAAFSAADSLEGGGEAVKGRLRAVARLIEDCARDNDLVARYSEDEFIVLMPQTSLAGALTFSHRLLKRASADLQCKLQGGVVEAKPDESPMRLLSRVDSALYSARTQEGPCLFQHNGATARRHSADGAPETAPKQVSEPASAPAEETGGREAEPRPVCGKIG